jgi:hypothetical protein
MSPRKRLTQRERTKKAAKHLTKTVMRDLLGKEPNRTLPKQYREAAAEGYMDWHRFERAKHQAQLESVRSAYRTVSEVYRTFTTHCIVCGNEMQARRKTKTTCSDKCRTRLGRERRQEAKQNERRAATPARGTKNPTTKEKKR